MGVAPDRRQARFVGLEGVRGIAALSVVAFHVWLYQTRGGQERLGHHLGFLFGHLWLGVNAFFVLSGFLLYRPFARAVLHATAKVDLARYTRARLLRIVPAYWVALTLIIVWTRSDLEPAAVVFLMVVALCAVAWMVVRVSTSTTASVCLLALAGAAGIALAVVASVDRKFDVALLSVTRNYLLLNTEQSRWVIVPAWTLSLEACFYICLPAFAFVAARVAARGSSRAARAFLQLPVLAALVGIGMGYRVLDHLYGMPILLPGYVDLFAFGMLLAVLLELRSTAPRLMRTMMWLAAVALFAAALSVEGAGLWSVLFAPATGLSFAIAIAAIALAPPVAHQAPARVLSAMGMISYGVYLWHWAIVNQVFYGHLRELRSESLAVNLFVVTGLSVVLATASWLIVERPLLALKARPLAWPWRARLWQARASLLPPTAPAARSAE